VAELNVLVALRCTENEKCQEKDEARERQTGRKAFSVLALYKHSKLKVSLASLYDKLFSFIFFNFQV